MQSNSLSAEFNSEISNSYYNPTSRQNYANNDKSNSYTNSVGRSFENDSSIHQ